jgi:hypothetical protein
MRGFQPQSDSQVEVLAITLKRRFSGDISKEGNMVPRIEETDRALVKKLNIARSVPK